MQEIICILDKSGSMAHIADDAKGGFNKFLEDQKELGDANMTLVFFDHEWEVRYSGPLSKCDGLLKWPNGGATALYDAIGHTMKFVASRFAKEKPEKVIMAILTDGQENSSQKYNAAMINTLITEHQEKYGWDVIFLASNQDAWQAASKIGIHANMTYQYDQVATGTAVGQTYSDAVTRSRMS